MTLFYHTLRRTASGMAIGPPLSDFRSHSGYSGEVAMEHLQADIGALARIGR